MTGEWTTFEETDEEPTTYLLICQTCGAKFVKDSCGCIVTDCPSCGDIASVWTDSIIAGVAEEEE